MRRTSLKFREHTSNINIGCLLSFGFDLIPYLCPLVGLRIHDIIIYGPFKFSVVNP